MKKAKKQLLAFLEQLVAFLEQTTKSKKQPVIVLLSSSMVNVMQGLLLFTRVYGGN